jgi:YD repeat-containing protein
MSPRPTRRAATRALITTLVIGVLLGAVRQAAADIAYLYDDLGRLVRVISPDGEAATYHYDAVGNILQITRESSVAQTTAVTSASASAGLRGVLVPVTITGSNLAGASVVCTTPGVTTQHVRTDVDRITLEVVISPSAPLGPAQCEVRGLAVVALPFSVTEPPPPIFLGSPAVSVAVGPRLAVNNNVLSAVSVAIGRGGTVFETASVSVAFMPVITGASPGAGAAGTPNLVLTLTGAGLTGATAVDFFRANTSDTAITVTTFSVNAAGTGATVELAIAPGAAAGVRVIRITTPAGQSTAIGTGGNLFTVQ